MSDRYALVYEGQVHTIVIWDGVSDYNPGDHYEKVAVGDNGEVQNGWTYVNGVFAAPPQPTAEELAAIEAAKQPPTTGTQTI